MSRIARRSVVTFGGALLTLAACSSPGSSSTSSAATSNGREGTTAGVGGTDSSGTGSSGGHGSSSGGSAGESSSASTTGTGGSSSGGHRTSGTTGMVGSATSSSAGGPGSGSGGLVAPPQAAAAGFHTLVFDQGGDAGWNVDWNLTGDPGYAWYQSGKFFGAGDGDPSVDGGILTVSTKGMTSATSSSNDAGYVGSAFGDGFYVEASAAMTAACVKASSGVTSAFWGMPIEAEIHPGSTDHWPGQTAGYVHYAELDFMEFWGLSVSYYTLDWWGIYQTTCASGFCDCGNNGGCHGVPANGAVTVPTGTDFSAFNVYGALLVPSQANDGGTGFTQGYFNDEATSSHNSWAAYDPASPPPPTGTQIFAVADTGHYYLIANTTNGCPLQLQYVRVWQAP